MSDEQKTSSVKPETPTPANKQETSVAAEREKYRMPIVSVVFYGLAGLVALLFFVFMVALGIAMAKSNDSGAIVALFVVSASSFFTITFLVATAQMFKIVGKIEWNTRR